MKLSERIFRAVHTSGIRRIPFLLLGRFGTPIHPRNLVRSFHALLRRAGLPAVRFHALRHSCASMLAAHGVPARVAIDILGHSDIRLTQNIYPHVFDEAKQQAADVVDRVFNQERARAG